MNKDPILKSPNLNLSADSNKTINYKRDANNYITQVFGEQLPAIKTGFFNIHMNKGFIVQPHWHTNVNELVFVISGEVVTSVFDPFTQKLKSYRIKPGQVSMLPLGWFHWIVAMKDNTHFLTIFDEATPDIVYGSDFLRFTPKGIMSLAYCVDEEKYAAAVAPIQESIILGPPLGCKKRTDSADPSSENRTITHTSHSSHSSPPAQPSHSSPSTYPPQPSHSSPPPHPSNPSHSSHPPHPSYLSHAYSLPQNPISSPQGYSSDGYRWNQAHPFNYYVPQENLHPYKTY
ncbi:cupin domain-containing protein [Paenibacillus polygoni]|uniref:cupin domain-containing protein n=1 Tax=Paenibacillus polygoni TaxID=3050112 RepID=UPI002A4E1342|nr:cupin domain-containing protein [Paenibacillus polygoni]